LLLRVGERERLSIRDRVGGAFAALSIRNSETVCPITAAAPPS